MFLSFSTFLPRLVPLDGLRLVAVQESQIYPEIGGGEGGLEKREIIREKRNEKDGIQEGSERERGSTQRKRTPLCSAPYNQYKDVSE